MSIQIENRLTQYIPNLNISQAVLQNQLATFIQSEREQLKKHIMDGENGFFCVFHAHADMGCCYPESLRSRFISDSVRIHETGRRTTQDT